MYEQEVKNNGKFDAIAAKYVARQKKEMRYPLLHKGTYYEYTKTHYTIVEDLHLRVRAWLLLEGKKQPNATISNSVPIIQIYGYRESEQDKVMPYWVNPEGKPDHRNIIAFANGLLDLSGFLAGNNALLPHSSTWISTSCLPFDFDPGASCPLWLKFLDQIYEGDAAKIGLLQEWAGYLLSSDSSAQKALILIGQPRSGKGTLFTILQHLLGSENWVGYDLGRLISGFGLHSLIARTAAFVPEVELTGRADRGLIVERLKSIIGEDAQYVDRKNQSAVTLRLPVRFTISANGIPSLIDPSGALSSRLLPIEHQVSFAGREDVNLAPRLLKELPGVALWALSGLSRLRENGMRFTLAGSDDLTRRIEIQSAPIRVFVRERCLVEQGFDSGTPGLTIVHDKLLIDKEVLFGAYQAWANECDATVTGYVNWFIHDLRLILSKIRDHRSSPSAKRQLRGISLRP